MFLKSYLRVLKQELKVLKTTLYYNPKTKEAIISHFHRLYYESGDLDGTWRDTRWFGTRVAKCPLDLWVYQEIIYALRPDVIVECGTGGGGSAHFMACICDWLDHGRIVTIDINEKRERPQHPRVQQLFGSSTSEQVVAQVKESIGNAKTVMVILDSDHSKDHVLNELRLYSPFVSQGSYLIVEDTNINGHPVGANAGPGPMEAVEAFLQENTQFMLDKDKEKFFMTFNPNGYLKRIK
jgi:cephalosporin hydroxylase